METRARSGRDLQQLTEDGCHVLVMSCRREDEVDVVKEIIHFNQNRPEGHGEVFALDAPPAWPSGVCGKHVH